LYGRLPAVCASNGFPPAVLSPYPIVRRPDKVWPPHCYRLRVRALSPSPPPTASWTSRAVVKRCVISPHSLSFFAHASPRSSGCCPIHAIPRIRLRAGLHAFPPTMKRVAMTPIAARPTCYATGATSKSATPTCYNIPHPGLRPPAPLIACAAATSPSLAAHVTSFASFHTSTFFNQRLSMPRSLLPSARPPACAAPAAAVLHPARPILRLLPRHEQPPRNTVSLEASACRIPPTQRASPATCTTAAGAVFRALISLDYLRLAQYPRSRFLSPTPRSSPPRHPDPARLDGIRKTQGSAGVRLFPCALDLRLRTAPL
jgi:hypothetical protein